MKEPRFKVGDRVFLRGTIKTVWTDGENHHYKVEIKGSNESWPMYDEKSLEYCP